MLSTAVLWYFLMMMNVVLNAVHTIRQIIMLSSLHMHVGSALNPSAVQSVLLVSCHPWFSYTLHQICSDTDTGKISRDCDKFCDTL